MSEPNVEVIEAELNEAQAAAPGPSNEDLGHALVGLMYQLSLVAERVSSIEQYLLAEVPEVEPESSDGH